MGWANSEAVINLWKLVRVHVPMKQRANVLADFIELFAKELDWDCEDEIAGEFTESEKALALYWPRVGVNPDDLS